MTENVRIALQNGFLFGVVICIYFTFGILLIGRANPMMLINDYPPDVQQRYRELRGNAEVETIRRNGVGLRIAFMLGLLGILVFSILHLQSLIGPSTYGTTAFSLFASTMTFNVFDLLVLDWLLFNTLSPRFAVLPGTEGMAGYKNFLWHFRGFVIGCVLSAMVAVVGAGYVELIQVLQGKF